MVMALQTLERVLARPGMGGVTLRHVRAMLAEGLAQRWPCDDGSEVVTKLHDEPSGRVCVIWLAAGDIRPLLEVHERIVDWAKAEGCQTLRIVGRRGWLRVLDDYEETAVVMEREL